MAPIITVKMATTSSISIRENPELKFLYLHSDNRAQGNGPNAEEPRCPCHERLAGGNGDKFSKALCSDWLNFPANVIDRLHVIGPANRVIHRVASHGSLREIDVSRGS